MKTELILIEWDSGALTLTLIVGGGLGFVRDMGDALGRGPARAKALARARYEAGRVMLALSAETDYREELLS